MTSTGADETTLQIRTHGNPAHPALIYLPGVHGDWTLVASFRKLIAEQFYFVEITYPRTLEWSIHEYARQVMDALGYSGISSGWILAESFSSQVGWAMLELERTNSASSRFTVDGLILAGGFVRYPFRPGLSIARCGFCLLPWQVWKMAFHLYSLYGRFRHRRAPESALSVPEFIARRTPGDIAAIRHRIRLISQYDPRPIARSTKLPVYLLAGTIDPIVFSGPVRRWLKANCPGYRGHRIIFPADHTVLATEPLRAAQQIRSWLGL